VLELLLVALALGLSNMAAAVGIGVSSSTPHPRKAAVRWRVALVFGLFEAGMPVVGVLAGHAASSALGGAARLTGGILLAAVGCYQLYAALRERAQGAKSDAVDSADGWGGWRLLVSGFALSLDNLVVGFALGAYHVGLIAAALVIGAVSVALSLAGLEAGALLGAAFGRLGTAVGGGVLGVVGLAIAVGWL
jgi:manganese efflux pump family protein